MVFPDMRLTLADRPVYCHRIRQTCLFTDRLCEDAGKKPAMTLTSTRTSVRPTTTAAPARAAFALQVSILVLLLAGSSAPTPLYAFYQAEWGFTPITVTIVFGAYALAVLAALLTFGSLSDHVGRRPVLLVALAMQVLAMAIFATADGVAELTAARIVQGLSTGAAVGALGAGLLDIDRAKGTIANAVAPMTGTAVGALGASLLIRYLPAPAHLVYLVLLAAFVLQAIGIALIGESVTRKPGALASLRPQFALPALARGPFLTAVPALVAVWALAGFYGSIGPTLVRIVVGGGSVVLGGLALFALAGSGGATVLLLRAVAARTLMALGAAALVIGVGLTELAMRNASAPTLFVGAVVAGLGFGAAFQGALRTVVPLAAPHQRAGLLSTVFVVSYLAMGLPAVIGGFRVVYGDGVLATAREYGFAVMGLAAVALLALARQTVSRRMRTVNR
jgi:MFS family permease